MRVETPTKRVARCLDLSQRQASRLDSETDDAREIRLLDQRDRQASRLDGETDDACEIRLLDQRDRQASRLDGETDDAREIRLLDQRDRQASRLDGETDDPREVRLLDLRDGQAFRLDSETEDAREIRLLNKRDRQTSRLDSETDDAREVRLLDQRDRQASRLDSETEDAREVRLLDQRDRQAWKIACETEEQASSRLKYQAKLYAKRVKSRIVLNFARSIIATEVPDTSRRAFRWQYDIQLLRVSGKFWAGEKLSGSTKSCYKFSLCCGEGKVVLLPVAPHPELLMHLLTATDPRGRAFREQIRAYNNVLAFASLGANLDKGLANAKRGVYTFRIHGVMYHRIGRLMPNEGEAPAFAQIYIHDGTADAEVANRQCHLGDAVLPELKGLQHMLHEVNPYVAFFRQGLDLMREQGGADVRMVKSRRVSRF